MIQLGTRWGFGEEPPARLEPDVVAKIREAEAELEAGAGLDQVRDGRWTLTWLERRPVAEFDVPTADGAFVTVTREPVSGAPVIRRGTDEEDWDDD